MRSILRHIVLLALTLSVVMGSVGVALSKQLCQVTGLQPASASSLPETCCAAPENKESKDDCCQEHVAYQKLEPVPEQKLFHLQVPLLAPDIQLPDALKYASGINPHIRVYTYTNTSPPLHGRQLLHFLHTLIV
ncbi:hypothetical protein [Pontibacter anaerobius]|uniref:Uncharacterized protein n=1 Tax=Pontibacter anaerobius TaxID=2993940 RepID=A0ABT3RF89_9BACT|nr:hypothetical protein [Pontibacter anaerobius]MCX2740176.1 hypothetical protein [Pontibacter anaerobius]